MIAVDRNPSFLFILSPFLLQSTMNPFSNSHEVKQPQTTESPSKPYLDDYQKKVCALDGKNIQGKERTRPLQMEASSEYECQNKQICWYRRLNKFTPKQFHSLHNKCGQYLQPDKWEELIKKIKINEGGVYRPNPLDVTLEQEEQIEDIEIDHGEGEKENRDNGNNNNYYSSPSSSELHGEINK